MFNILIDRYEGTRAGDFHCRDMRFSPKGSFVFTVCRNPYIRAVSIWWSTCMRGHDRYGFRHACGNGDDFETFIVWAATQIKRPPLIQNQTEWQYGLTFDRILHLEDLAHEFSLLPFIKEQTIEFPEMNTTLSNRQPARHYLTPLAIEAIKSWAKPDFDEFGYSRTPPILANQHRSKTGRC